MATAKKSAKTSAPVVSKTEPKKTSEGQRAFLLKNGFTEAEIPALSRDSMREMDLIIAAQRKRRAGAPTDGQIKYLTEEMGYKRQDALRFTFGEASALIGKNQEARGIKRTRKPAQASA